MTDAMKKAAVDAGYLPNSALFDPGLERVDMPGCAPPVMAFTKEQIDRANVEVERISTEGPRGSNADEWALFISENGVGRVAVKIANLLDELTARAEQAERKRDEAHLTIFALKDDAQDFRVRIATLTALLREAKEGLMQIDDALTDMDQMLKPGEWLDLPTVDADLFLRSRALVERIEKEIPND